MSTKRKTARGPVLSATRDTRGPDPAPIDEAAVAELAYSYWQERGANGGSPEEDWFRATEEIRRREAIAGASPPPVAASAAAAS